MHFIFVACNKNKKLYRNDPSFIYRCENLAYGLKELGHSVAFTHLSSFSLKNRADVVVFHRPGYSLKLFATVLYLKYRSVPAVFDVDDLVFDPEYAKDSPAFRNKILSLKKVKKQFQKNLKALNLFSHFSVSTDPLAKHIKDLIPHSHIIKLPNAVHHSWRPHQEEKVISKTKKLTYFPGTKSHDKDFETISKGLTQFLKNHPDVKLYITGPLKFDLDIPSSQIVHKEKVPFSEHWRNYQNVWVNLAPLEKTPFTECKSALKIIEAAYWGIPTLCTSNPDTKRFVNAGAVIAQSEEEWLTALKALYDSDTYAQITKNLQYDVLKLADVKKIAQVFLDHIEQEIIPQPKKRYLNPSFPRVIAKSRRKKGLYDLKTLWYYKKAWLKKRDPKAFVDYCMFRRDLGFILSKNRSDLLISLLDKLGRKHKKYAIFLLKEVSYKYTSDTPLFKENRAWLNKIHENQEQWRRSFKEELVKNRKNGICVVGNSATLKNSMCGDTIDQQGFIVRFNQCWNKNKGNKDTGKKLDVWVSAPDYRGETQSTARWIIVSGPDMIYREVGWERFKDRVESDGYLLTVPLEIWKKLVFRLQAPPSAGLLTLFWFSEILGSWDGICATGFDLTVSMENYHHADLKHQPGKRHNWQKEKDLLTQWRKEGLKFL